jgi:SSS family solute:Na+ symporter
VIELVNRIGSAFYGPVLAVFIAAALFRRAGSRSVLSGLVAGLTLNITLWIFAPAISWLWWNPAGFFTALFFILVVPSGPPAKSTPPFSLTEIIRDRRTWILIAVFVLIVVISALIGALAG